MRERALQARVQARGLPLLYTEWNITANSRDPLHDQAFAAALAVRIAMSVDAIVDGYGYWTFSDIFEEDGFPSTPFHGGFGLLTLHGIAKPIYRAFQLMLRLGDGHLPVLGSHETVVVWVGKLNVGERPTSNVLLVNQAMPRQPICSETAQLRLTGIVGRHPRRVTISRIDADHCNPLAAWRALGQPEYLTTEHVERISAAATLSEAELAFSFDGEMAVIEVNLPPQSVALLQIEWNPS
jgi:xylan 1,4-beta-xylosidase